MTTLREAAQMAYAVPLHELLATVPRDARLVIEDADGKGTRFIPVGRYCHEAAEALRARLSQPEQEPVGNTITFMTRAIFNVVAKHQEINGGYFIADGDVAAFVDRLAKVINSTFEPLKPKNTAPPQREWQGLTDEEIREFEIWLDDEEEKRGWNPPADIVKHIEAKLKEKNT